MNLISGKTRIKFTHLATGQVWQGVFIHEDAEAIHIKTDDCPKDEEFDFGLHQIGIELGEWECEVIK